MFKKKNKKSGNQTVNIDALNFLIRESYKTARTNIDYSIIKKGCKKVVFTSSAKGEGKTLSSVNIASALAQQVDTKVILVETDLRRPHVHLALGLAPSPGITNCLNGECELSDIIKPTHLANLSAICYGAIPPNPSELLGSSIFEELINRVKQEYDYVIMDTPPLGVVADTLLLKNYVAGYGFVVRERVTTHGDIESALQSIKIADTKIIGFLKVGCDIKSKKGYNKYGRKYGYGYYGY